MFDKEYGYFTDVENVKVKEFPDDVYKKAKKDLMDLGITSYWADHILQEVVGMEDDNVGKKVVDMLTDSGMAFNPAAMKNPFLDNVIDMDKIYDKLYGKIEEIINDLLEVGDYVELDIMKVPLKSHNKVKDFKISYEIPIKKDTPFQGTVLLTVKNDIFEGARDDLNFKVEYQNSDGKYIEVEKVKILTYEEKYLDSEKYNSYYQMVLDGIKYDDVKSIRLTYNNKFDLPTPPAKAIANGIQDVINDLVKVGDPISNKARNDIAEYLDENLNINDMYYNGDYALIITDLICQIKVVGDVIEYGGFKSDVADEIRKIINQDEVISKAEISNIKIYAKSISDEDLPFDRMIDFDEKEFDDRMLDMFRPYTYNFVGQTYYSSVGWYIDDNAFQLIDHHKDVGPKTIIRKSYCQDFIYTADLAINRYKKDLNEEDKAGLIFRSSEIGKGKDNFKGYYCYISDKENKVGISKYDGKKSIELESIPMDIKNNKFYKVKVIAEGEKIDFYVDNMSKPLITIKDSSYKNGYLGMRYYSSEANKTMYFDNVYIKKIEEKTLDDQGDSQKNNPDTLVETFNDNSDNWKVLEGYWDVEDGQYTVDISKPNYKGLIRGAVSTGNVSILAYKKYSDVEFQADFYMEQTGDSKGSVFAELLLAVDEPYSEAEKKRMFNGYDISIYKTPYGDFLKLYKVDDGNFGVPMGKNWDVELGNEIVENIWHTVKVKHIGSVIEIYFDNMDTPILTCEDSKFQNGYIGLRESGDGTMRARFDNVKVRELSN